jgi:NADH dehydrogenase
MIALAKPLRYRGFEMAFGFDGPSIVSCGNKRLIMTGIVTVFGGSGFVGKQVVRALAKKGWRIRVAARNTMIAYDLKLMGDVGQIQVVRCDVRREADIARALNGADACVNLVGILYQSWTRNFDALHHQASAKMAHICAQMGIKDFVQISAIGAEIKARSSYARTKGLAEEAVRASVPTAIILRPSVIFGTDDGFFNMVAAQMKMLPFMPAIGGGKTAFQPVYVGDVAAAVAKTLAAPKSYGKTYELGGPKVYAFRDLVKYCGDLTLNPRPQIYMPFFVAQLIGMAGDLMCLTPFAPLVTSDQVALLKKPNVVAIGALTFKDLDIAPTALESVVPSYLWRYRKGGQFAAFGQVRAR